MAHPIKKARCQSSQISHKMSRTKGSSETNQTPCSLEDERAEIDWELELRGDKAWKVKKQLADRRKEIKLRRQQERF